MQAGQSSWRPEDSANNTPDSPEGGRRPLARRVTEIPVFTSPVPTTGRNMPRTANDGVFANLSAKPDSNEKTEDQPPVCIFISYPPNHSTTWFSRH